MYKVVYLDFNGFTWKKDTIHLFRIGATKDAVFYKKIRSFANLNGCNKVRKLTLKGWKTVENFFY